MSSEEEYGTVVPIIYVAEDSAEFWRGSPENAPSNYTPVGWIKIGEHRLYVDKSQVDLTSQYGMPEELQQPDTLSDSSTEADIKRELIGFIKQSVSESSASIARKHREITFIDLEQHLISCGYDPSGSHTYSEPGSNAIYWKADETFITAVTQLVDENWLRIYSGNLGPLGTTLETYQEQASNLDRSIPVSHLPVAKRLGEYSYKNPHWGVVYFKPGSETRELFGDSEQEESQETTEEESQETTEEESQETTEEESQETTEEESQETTEEESQETTEEEESFDSFWDWFFNGDLF